MRNATLQLWAMAGAAPDAAARREVLDLLSTRSHNDLMTLLLEHPNSGPAAGTLPGAELPARRGAGHLLLAGALADDPDTLDLVLAEGQVFAMDDEPSALFGLGINPHALTRHLRASLGWMGSYTRSRSTERLLANWTQAGVSPDGDMLATLADGDVDVLTDALAVHGSSVHVIEQALASLPAGRAVRTSCLRNLGGIVARHAGVQSQFVLWLLDADVSDALDALQSLAAYEGWRVAADAAVRERIVELLTGPSAPASLVENFTRNAREHLSGADLRRLTLAGHTVPACSGQVPAAQLSGESVIRALADTDGPIWAATARLLNIMAEGDPTPIDDLIGAAGTATSDCL